MLGKDFFVYWQIGRALLAGLDPYAVPESLYPPAALGLFTAMALLPFTLAFATWTGVNVVMLAHSLVRLVEERRRWLWFAFPPALFVILTGQLDLLMLWASTFLPRGGYTAALFTAILSLKPQAAFIVLPWFLLQWLRTDRPTLLKATAMTALLHLVPLVSSPHLYPDWIASVGRQSAWRLEASPGLFVLTDFDIPWFIVAPLAVAMVIVGLTRSRQASAAAQVCALPMGLWYESVFLIGAAPLWLILPLAWGAFVMAASLHTSWPLAAMPVAAFLWRWRTEVRRLDPEAPAST